MRLSPETTARRPIVLLTAAASFALGIAPLASGQNAGGEAGIAPSAGDFAGGTSDGTAVRPTAAEVIDQAKSLLERGQPVKAEALLRLLSEPSFAVGMSDAEAGAYFRLLRRARAAVSEADPIDVRLERAELALAESKLSSAEEHAARVLETQGASEEQEARAQAIRESIEAARSAIEQRADTLLADVESAFQAGDYAAAKTALVRLERSGVELGDAETDRAADLSARIRDIEVATGRSISPDTLTLGLLEPDRLSKDWIVGVSASSQPEEPDQDGAEQEGTAQEQPEGEQAADEAPPEDPVQQALRLEAQRLLTEADAAFDASRFAEARRKYRQLLQPGLRGTLGQAEIDRVEQRLEEAQLELRGPGDLLGEEIQERELARQQVLAEFENQIQQANEALEQGDFESARQAAAGARLSVAQGRQVLGQAEFAELESRVESLQNRITTAEERRETRLAEERAREIAQARREAEREQQSQRQQEIRELLNRIFDLQQQMEYERALEEVERLLFIDPNNTAGLMLRDVFRDTLLFRRHEEAKREIDRRVAEASVSNFEAAVPPEGLIDYPEDWVEISRRRGDPLQYTESAVNRAVLATLEQERLPVDFQEVPIENVLTFLSTFANLELDVDWQSLDAIGVNRQDTITLQLTNVPLQVALERTLDKVSDPDLAADWAVRDGVLTVASEDALRRNTVLELYDIRDLLIEIPDYEEAPEFDLDSIFSQGGEGGGGGGQSPFQTQDQDPERQTREELIQRIVDIIQNNVDQNGWQAFGGQTGTIEEFNGSLIITNTPKNHRAITGLLSRLREVRNLQINIEARFLSVNEDFFEQIGFDIDLFFGGDSEIVQTAQAVDPSVSLDDFFAETDEGNALPELVDNVNGGGGFDADGSGTITLDETTAQQRLEPSATSDDFTPVSTAQGSLSIVEALGAGTDFASTILGGAPALGVAGRFLDDVQVDFLLQATQADRRSVQLTAPRLTLTNGQRAYVAVGTQTAFVSDATPVVSTSAVGFDPTVDVVTSGSVLDVTGVVSADRRYVTLDLVVNQASVDLDSTETVQAVAGGTGGTAGGGIVATEIGLPIVTGSEVATTVTVPDQGTILLGGQRVVTEIETESGVPVLSKVPVLNRFFSNRIDATTEQTLLILVKPTILIQNEQEELQYPGLLDSLGR